MAKIIFILIVLALIALVVIGVNGGIEQSQVIGMGADNQGVIPVIVKAFGF